MKRDESITTKGNLMTLNYEQTIDEHQRMWRWIADKTRERRTAISKFEYIRKQQETDLDFTKKIGHNYCFLCQYAEQLRTSKKTNLCRYCIGCWENGNCEMDAKYPYDAGLYLKWLRAWGKNDWEAAEKYADQIANLPMKPIQKATNIKWNINDDETANIELPTEISIPKNITEEADISDYLSELTDFCHKGFSLETCE